MFTVSIFSMRKVWIAVSLAPQRLAEKWVLVVIFGVGV